jgi:hypothetical protein
MKSTASGILLTLAAAALMAGCSTTTSAAAPQAAAPSAQPSAAASAAPAAAAALPTEGDLGTRAGTGMGAVGPTYTITIDNQPLKYATMTKGPISAVEVMESKQLSRDGKPSTITTAGALKSGSFELTVPGVNAQLFAWSKDVTDGNVQKARKPVVLTFQDEMTGREGGRLSFTSCWPSEIAAVPAERGFTTRVVLQYETVTLTGGSNLK